MTSRKWFTSETGKKTRDDYVNQLTNKLNKESQTVNARARKAVIYNDASAPKNVDEFKEAPLKKVKAYEVRGYCLQEPYASSLFLSENPKTEEVKSVNSCVRQQLYIVPTGTSHAIGTVEMYKVFQTSKKEIKKRTLYNHINDFDNSPVASYTNFFVYCFRNAKKFDCPIQVHRQKGQVTWLTNIFNLFA